MYKLSDFEIKSRILIINQILPIPIGITILCFMFEYFLHVAIREFNVIIRSWIDVYEVT